MKKHSFLILTALLRVWWCPAYKAPCDGPLISGIVIGTAMGAPYWRDAREDKEKLFVRTDDGGAILTIDPARVDHSEFVNEQGGELKP